MDINNTYLKKDYKDQNSIYLFLKKSKDNKYYILKSIDTLTNDEKICAIENSEFIDNFYSINELFSEENYIGRVGISYKMNELEKIIYKNFIIIYKDNYHEFIYDNILDTYFISGSFHKIDEFIFNDKKYEFSFQRKKK